MLRVIVFLVALTPALAIAENLTVKKVSRVYDGDTFRAEIASDLAVFSQISVRIRGIDAPEISEECEREKIAAIAAREMKKTQTQKIGRSWND